jgi:hypothetical protein
LVKINDDIDSKIAQVTVKRKYDPSRASNETIQLKEHQSFDEFSKQIQYQLDAKANLSKKSTLASSPDKTS